MLVFVPVCCSVLKYVAMCCSVLQCVEGCCSVQTFENVYLHTQFHEVEVSTEVRDVDKLWAIAVCCSVLQCVAVCCSVLQCVAVCCSVLQGADVGVCLSFFFFMGEEFYPRKPLQEVEMSAGARNVDELRAIVVVCS